MDHDVQHPRQSFPFSHHFWDKGFAFSHPFWDKSFCFAHPQKTVHGQFENSPPPNNKKEKNNAFLFRDLGCAADKKKEILVSHIASQEKKERNIRLAN